MGEMVLTILIFFGVIAITVLVFGGWMIVSIGRLVWRALAGPGQSSLPRSLPGQTVPVRCTADRCHADNPPGARFCRACQPQS